MILYEMIETLENVSEERMWSRKWIAGIFITALLSATIPLNIVLRSWTDFGPSDRLRIIGIIVSGFLTSALLIVYIDMSDIQNSQSNILELDHKPNIRIDALSGGYKDGTTFLKMKISNIGEGPANNLSAVMEPITEIEGMPVSSQEYILEKTGDDSDDWISTGEPHIGSKSSGIEFRTPVALDIDREDLQEILGEDATDDIPIAFEEATTLYDRRDHDYIRIKFWVKYDNNLQNSSTSPDIDLVLPIKGRTSLEESLKYATDYESFREFPSLFEERRGKMDRDSCYSPTFAERAQERLSDSN